MKNGTIVAFNNSTHQKVQELLPWFIVGTLNDEEQALVRGHLHDCGQCQADLAWQRKLQGIAPSSEVHPDVDQAFARLRPQLETMQRRPRRRTLRELLDDFWHGDSHWLRWTLVAQFSVILALAFMLATPSANLPTYRALGAAKTGEGNLVVVFKPETSEQDLRRILQAADARIVDGPTATDAYILSVPEKKRTTALHDLRAYHAVVLAESLGAGGAH